MAMRAILYLSVAAFAFATRSIGYASIFSPVGVQLPYAGDAYYHLRRIVYSVARFPESITFDPYVSFPVGAQIHWPAAFDWSIASAIRLFVDPMDQPAVEAYAVWAPVVLGTLTSCAVAGLAERFYGRGAAWWAGIGYSLMPIVFIYSQLGNIDHHVAVALSSTLLLWIACEITTRDEHAPTWGAAFQMVGTRFASGMGLAIAATLLTWPGALLHVMILQAAFGVWWLVADGIERARARAIAFASSQAVVAICVTPFAWNAAWREFGDWSPMVISRFQPVYFGCAAAMIVLAQWIFERLRAEDIPRRAAVATALTTIGVAVALTLAPPLREAIVSAAGWFSEDEILHEMSNEMQPLLFPQRALDLDFAISRFGAGILAFPLVLIVLGRRARRNRSTAQALMLFWAIAFGAFTLRQWRFGNTLAPIYAVMVGACLASWTRSVRGWVRAPAWRPVGGIVLVAMLLAWTAFAWTRFYRPIIELSTRAWRSELVRARGPLRPSIRLFDQAGRWLERHTPVTRGYLDVSLRPEYGVLAPWNAGHLLRYRSKRPMVIDNFGPYAGRETFDSARAYFAATEEEAAIGVLERLGVRYVIGVPGGAGIWADLAPSAMSHRLALGYGSWMSTDEVTHIPGLARHRMLYYTQAPTPRPPRGGAGQGTTSLGIWEVVRGARIEGRTGPGARVRLSLPLVTSSGLQTTYQRTTVADARGRYAFVVPYPTDVRFSPDVDTTGGYWLQGPGGRARLAVPEEAIRTGAAVRAPRI